MLRDDLFGSGIDRTNVVGRLMIRDHRTFISSTRASILASRLRVGLMFVAILLNGCGGRPVVERVKDPEDTDTGLAAAKLKPPAALAKPASDAAAKRASTDKALETAKAGPTPAAFVAKPAPVANSPAAKPGAKAKRPTDLSAWQPEDYFSARTEKDTKLIAAVG